MTKLTEHFSFAEMTRSQTATRKGIRNVPSVEATKALILLCEKVLEPVRAHFGVPVRISSGYRSPRLNQAIGGSRSSQHCKGEAADFTLPGVSNIDVVRWMHAKLDYDQLIYEYGESGWIHCSYSAHRMRNAELTARRVRGRTKYLTGIVT